MANRELTPLLAKGKKAMRYIIIYLIAGLNSQIRTNFIAFCIYEIYLILKYPDDIMVNKKKQKNILGSSMSVYVLSDWSVDRKITWL